MNVTISSFCEAEHWTFESNCGVTLELVFLPLFGFAHFCRRLFVLRLSLRRKPRLCQVFPEPPLTCSPPRLGTAAPGSGRWEALATVLRAHMDQNSSTSPGAWQPAGDSSSPEQFLELPTRGEMPDASRPALLPEPSLVRALLAASRRGEESVCQGCPRSPGTDPAPRPPRPPCRLPPGPLPGTRGSPGGRAGRLSRARAASEAAV